MGFTKCTGDRPTKKADSTSSATGDTGLFVIPTDDLSSAPIFVTRTPRAAPNVIVAGLAKQAIKTSDAMRSSSPYAVLYLATGNDGNVHMYGLKLAGTSGVPTATQVSSLSLGSLDEICGLVGFAPTRLDDPTTLFTVIRSNAAGRSSCGQGDQYDVVHFTDSQSTAALAINITTPTSDIPIATPLRALYQADGSFGGAVLLDSATGSLNFYRDDTFTQPATLVTGVSLAYDLIDDRSVANTGFLGAHTTFISVHQGKQTSLWRVDAS